MRVRDVAVVAVIVVAVTACSPSDRPGGTTDDDVITVASFDFDESELIAELYVGALRHAGFDVDHARRVGSREIVLPSLERGLIEVVPEYAGSAVEFLGGRATADPGSSNATLRTLLQARGIDALAPAPAQSRNGLVVAPETAAALALRSVSDLRGVASEMTLGGPPECPDRDLCIPGFDDVYGITFASFLPLDAGGPITAEAVARGTVDVGVLFTSDGSLAAPDLVLLRDDRRLQPAENVTPLVHDDAVSRFGPSLTDALKAVSTELTTTELRELNSKVREGENVRQVAARWLREHGLAGQPG